MRSQGQPLKGKHLALRALLFGVVATVALFAVCFALLLVLERLHVGPRAAWPLFLFVVPGIPLAEVLSLIPGLSLDWLPNYGDGPVGPAVAKVFFSACVTWPVIFASVRYWVLARRVHAGDSDRPPALTP
jgi:hypothetical protein